MDVFEAKYGILDQTRLGLNCAAAAYVKADNGMVQVLFTQPFGGDRYLLVITFGRSNQIKSGFGGGVCFASDD